MPAKQTKEQVVKIAFERLKINEYGDDFVKEFTILFAYLSISQIRSDLDRLFAKFLLGGYPYDLTDRYIKLKSLGGGITKQKMLLFYGPTVGAEKWETYRTTQAITNTFEYKNKKYGMTEQEFKEFNKSRATTLENMILRHGEELGRDKWEKYCNNQAYAGTSLEYFVDKFGIEDGTIKYKTINKSKGLTSENFIKKYGEQLGLEKYEAYVNNSSLTYYSKISQELFKSLEILLNKNKINTSKIYYAEKNNEFGKMYKNTYKKFDYVDTLHKVAIEFNGDDWHANPKKYHPNEKIKVKGKVSRIAKDIWNADEEKLNILRDLGYNIITVWESDYNNNKEDIIEKVYEKLYRNK